MIKDLCDQIVGALDTDVIVAGHGRKRVFHALPRLLTALIEHGSDVARITEAAAGKRSADATAAAMLNRLNKHATEEQVNVRAVILYL